MCIRDRYYYCVLGHERNIICKLFIIVACAVGQVLWLTALIIPMLSLSLVGAPTDPHVMHRATAKNHCKMNAEVSAVIIGSFYAVSYTHLDVYKRQ